jgi:hypothetical protein
VLKAQLLNKVNPFIGIERVVCIIHDNLLINSPNIQKIEENRLDEWPLFPEQLHDDEYFLEWRLEIYVVVYRVDHLVCQF